MLKKTIKNKHFRPKCECNLIHKCGPQNLTEAMVRSLCCYTVNILLNAHYYPINENYLTGQDKQGVTQNKE